MEKKSLPINLDLLKWARKKAGLSFQTVAELGKIKPLRARKDKPGLSAAERVQAWEEGSQPLTWRCVETLAKVYRRPAITFFLAAPPIEEVKVADFRTVADKHVVVNSPEFAAFMRRIDVLHEEIVELVGDTKPDTLSFLGSATIETPAQLVIDSIRKTLNLPYDEQKRTTDGDDLFRVLRRKIQDANIFVLIEGDLGSYSSQISPEEFRGIAICHPKAPLIVINPYDAKSARLFTLIHELTHLWLGDSAVSNTSLFPWANCIINSKETFCNNVAAEFLVPSSVLLEYFSQKKHQDVETAIVDFAKHFKVSRAVIARRLHDLNKIDNEIYWRYLDALRIQWEMSKIKQRNSGGGPRRSVLDKFRLGEKLIHTVLNGAEEGLISFQDASRILKVKVARFDAISQ